MTLDNSFFQLRKSAHESPFIRANQEAVYARIETLKESLLATQNVVRIEKELTPATKENVAEQVAKFVQQSAEVENLPRESTGAEVIRIDAARQAVIDATNEAA